MKIGFLKIIKNINNNFINILLNPEDDENIITD